MKEPNVYSFYDECYVYYGDYVKEIERLNKRIEDLSIINEEHKILNEMIRKELQQKENIIKEVREYIKEHSYDYRVGGIAKVNGKELLEILDKVGSDKE